MDNYEFIFKIEPLWNHNNPKSVGFANYQLINIHFEKNI